MKMKKIVSAVLAGLMTASLALSFTGCSSSKKPEGTIGIGGIGPTTGDAAIYGVAVKNGAEIAVEEINAMGGLQFSLNFQDDVHDAEKSVNAYNTLKDWGMQVLLGSVTTTPCLAVASEANADHIFELTPSASSTDVLGGFPDASGSVTIARRDNVFQMCFTDPNQGTAAAEYINEQHLGEKIAVIYNSSDVYSKGIYEKFTTKAAELGMNIVSTTSFTNDTATDFTVQIGEAKSKDADLIFLPIYYTPASLILKQAGSEFTPNTNEQITLTGRVGQWLGMTFIECAMLAEASGKYYDYSGTLKTVDFSKVDYIMYNHRALSIIDSFEAARLRDSEDFVGTKAQVEMTIIDGNVVYKKP